MIGASKEKKASVDDRAENLAMGEIYGSWE